jgi:hypothetical protein
VSTLSLRGIAERDVGLTGTISVNADVYGYRYRDGGSRMFGALDQGEVLLGAGTADQPTARSLRRHLETVPGTSIDLVLFLVGHRADFSGVVTVEQVVKIQYAVQQARDIYAQRDLGIRRVEWGYLTPEQAGGFTDITSVLEGALLTQEFTGRPGAIDLFLVQTIGAKAGRSPIKGPCDKDSLGLRTGIIMELNQTPQFSGVVIAHESGHYLGLSHTSDPDNLMCGPKLFHRCDPSDTQTGITAEQAATMKEHCMIHRG